MAFLVEKDDNHTGPFANPEKAAHWAKHHYSGGGKPWHIYPLEVPKPDGEAIVYRSAYIVCAGLAIGGLWDAIYRAGTVFLPHCHPIGALIAAAVMVGILVNPP